MTERPTGRPTSRGNARGNAVERERAPAAPSALRSAEVECVHCESGPPSGAKRYILYRLLSKFRAVTIESKQVHFVPIVVQVSGRYDREQTGTFCTDCCPSCGPLSQWTHCAAGSWRAAPAGAAAGARLRLRSCVARLKNKLALRVRPALRWRSGACPTPAKPSGTRPGTPPGTHGLN